jgi:hypothetical protein
VRNFFIATSTWSALSRIFGAASFGHLFQMAALQTYSLTVFVGGVNGRVFPACRFLLKRLEVDKLQSVGLRHPDWVALSVLVEQAERSRWCEIVTHGDLQFRLILNAMRPAVSDAGHVKMCASTRKCLGLRRDRASAWLLRHPSETAQTNQCHRQL